MNALKHIQAVTALTKRILPNHWEQIQYEEIMVNEGSDSFEIDHGDHRIIIRGNNTISMAAGLGHYLKYTAKCNISWCGSDLTLPEKLLLIYKLEHHVIEQQCRTYFNFCTFGYSAVWWDWSRWEQEIDFMAINGINMPLSVVGTEGIWYLLLQEMGFDDQECRMSLSGPCFLPWQWMGNLEAFHGPLPLSWIHQHIELGKKIACRQRELGMRPIRQGFSGTVPGILSRKFPHARISLKKPWFGFEAATQLDPTDPLFQTIGKRFLEIQGDLFGETSFYATDPFHEGEPIENSPEYMNRVGNAVKTLLSGYNPDFVWVVQSWSIRKDIVSVMSDIRRQLLILDYKGCYEKHENFWGFPFLTGSLHNFGGRTNLHGDLTWLAENQYKKLSGKLSNLVGTGLCMEGINQNPVYYDLALEMLTAREAVNLEQWLYEYILRRYKTKEQTAADVWRVLWKTVYSEGTNGVESSSIICARPAVDCKKSGPNEGFTIPYGNGRLCGALEQLLMVDSVTKGYEYDVRDIARQVLSNCGQRQYVRVSDYFKNRERANFRKEANRFLELLDDVDRLLSSCSLFRMEQWISDARSWGETEREKDYYEHCASVLVTIWGDEENPFIFDYAWKEWSGLIGQYYRYRWEMFFDFLEEMLEQNYEYAECGLDRIYGREVFRANEFYDRLADWECNWGRMRKEFEPIQNFKISYIHELIEKYKDLL